MKGGPMAIFEFNLSEIPEAVSILTDFIIENPILCAALFISYLLFYLYSFINNRSVDSEVYEIDLISSAISSIMVALLLIGLDENNKGFAISGLDFSSQKTITALYLFIFAVILIIFAFTKILPKFLVIILGNNELDLFINFVAVLMTDERIVLTGTLLAVIGIPLAALFIVQRIRRAVR